MNSVIEVRRTARSDGAVLRGVRLRALEDAPYAFGETLEAALAKPVSDFEADAIRHSTSNRSASFLALEGSEAAGMIGAFFDETTGNPFICALWVTPTQRGTDLAQRLVAKAASWLFEQSAGSIFAWVVEDNSRAIAFYEKFGFIDSGQRQALPSNIRAHERLYSYANPGS